MTSKEYIEDKVKSGEKYIKKYPDCRDFIKSELEHYKQVLKDLERLEQIDNANSSEALKILETFENDGLLNKEIGAIMYNQIWLKNQIEVLKQTLLKAQEQEKENAYLKEVIKKQDKILEILKKAYTNHIWSLYADTYELASSGFYRKIEITQEQSHLFEEWLNGR